MYLLANRWLLAVPFVLLFIAGILFTFYPSVAMMTVAPDNFFPRVWSVLLAASAASSIYGIVRTNKWFWEYVSTLLLFALLVIYGMVIFAYAGMNSLNYLAPSLIVLVPASMLVPRFLAVQKEIQDNK